MTPSQGTTRAMKKEGKTRFTYPPGWGVGWFLTSCAVRTTAVRTHLMFVSYRVMYIQLLCVHTSVFACFYW